MSTIIESKQVGNYTVNVVYDEDSTSPREWDDLSTIYSNHKHYSPDNHDIDEVIVEDENDEKGWRLNLDGMVALNVWMFEHSCCRFNTSELDEGNAFGNGMYARFDSGWFGIIAMPIEKAKKEWGENWEKMAKQYMEGCIEDYDAYANGEVYGVEVRAKDGSLEEYSGGFYDENEALAEGVAIAEQYNADDKKEIEEMLEKSSLQDLKELWYEKATTAPSWVDEVFELVEEDKAKEWLKTKLKEFLEAGEWDDD